jgi:diguanylate cyclase (GGDEF)-like protein/PAS domain S-box-containing protein
MSRYEKEATSPALAIPHEGPSWRERAERVRAGDAALAEAPATVGLALMSGLFDTILRTSFDAVVLCDRLTGEYLEVSDSFCRLTGYARAELLGRSSVELGIVEPGGIRQVAAADSALGHEGMYENTIVRRDGEHLVVEFTHSFLQDGYTLVVARDMTARRAREVALEQLARIDELTGVLNRRGFRGELETALSAARADLRDLHVLVADADGLKHINDDLGHEYGDQLLTTTALMLRAATAPYGAVGRFGGDEFVAFLPIGSRADVDGIVARLTESLTRRRIGPDGDQRPVSASIGVASASEAGYDQAALLALADARMYAVKATRR